jgi:demethylmenaquinone methyltransferase / 2-methoxy-6-polyprenyl-1,4-benzoquinol methylase
MHSVSSDNTANPSRRESGRMFDRIVGHYDFLNHVLSLRRDVAWRKHVARMLPKDNTLRILDLASGTGDLLLAILAERPDAACVVGVDMAPKMLFRCKEKLARRHARNAGKLVRGDAAVIATGDETFDAVTMAFGIRNMPDISAALREMRRVLKPGGRVLILEFSMPRKPFRWVYLFYLRHILPRVAGYFSGDRAAYEYLDRTIEHFPFGEAFCRLMREVGFQNVSATPQTFGIATIYQGER